MKKFFFTIIFFVILAMPLAGLLAADPAPANTPCSGSLCLSNPLGSAVNTPTEFIGRVLNSLFGVVGSLALVMFIYGGLTWMTSSGNAEKLKKGRDILVWSAIGLFVVFSSYAIVRVILSTIAG